MSGTLVLTRRPGERIYIYPKGHPEEAIAVDLIESAKYQSRLGFSASPVITIMREEIMTPTDLARIPIEIRQCHSTAKPEKPSGD